MVLFLLFRRVGLTYTFTFFNSKLAVGVCGLSNTLTAMTAATVKATEVKKPKTFWMRTREECIVAVRDSAIGVVRRCSCGFASDPDSRGFVRYRGM